VKAVISHEQFDKVPVFIEVRRRAKDLQNALETVFFDSNFFGENLTKYLAFPVRTVEMSKLNIPSHQELRLAALLKRPEMVEVEPGRFSREQLADLLELYPHWESTSG
jgi:hypothetical protein